MVRLIDRLDMTIDIDRDVKPQHNNKPTVITKATDSVKRLTQI